MLFTFTLVLNASTVFPVLMPPLTICSITAVISSLHAMGNRNMVVGYSGVRRMPPSIPIFIVTLIRFSRT